MTDVWLWANMALGQYGGSSVGHKPKQGHAKADDQGAPCHQTMASETGETQRVLAECRDYQAFAGLHGKRGGGFGLCQSDDGTPGLRNQSPVVFSNVALRRRAALITQARRTAQMTSETNTPLLAILEVAKPADHRPTMSSREIAELTGSTHDNVLKTVRSLKEKGVVSGNEAPYTHPQNGQTYKEFLLNYRDTMVVVSGYSVELRARIVDRWQELEERARGASVSFDPSDPKVMLAVFGHLQKQVAEKDALLAVQAVKVEAHDRIAEAYGTFCRSTAAKMLAVPPHTLIRWLRTNGWTFRRAGDKDDLAYQSKIAAGLLEHKVTAGPRPDGTEWSGTQVRVTAKGLTVLAKVFPPAASEAFAQPKKEG